MPFNQRGSHPVSNIHCYNDTTGGSPTAFIYIGKLSGLENCIVPFIESRRSLTLILEVISIVHSIVLRSHGQTPEDPLGAGLEFKTLGLKREQGSVQIKGVNDKLTPSAELFASQPGIFCGRA